jgi:uncharacterized protein YgiB involved in biofilm formation
MLQTTELSYKLTQPLVTNMGLSYQSIVLSTAAKFLAFDSPEEAAQSMYETIEQSMSSKADAEERRKFWEDVIKEMTEIAPKFSTEVAKLYFKLVVKTYGLPKP